MSSGCRLVGVELLDEAIDLPSFHQPPRAAYVSPIVVRQVLGALGGIGARLQRLVRRPDREREAGPEPVGGAHQVAEVQRLRDALGTDPEVAAGQCGGLCLAHGASSHLGPGV